MNELHTSQNNAPTFEPTKEQAQLLCDSSNVLSKDTLDALEELGDVLKGIHKRMVSEGYEIVDGNIRKVMSQNINVYEKA
jgi:ribosomal protein S19E (S16A)